MLVSTTSLPLIERSRKCLYHESGTFTFGTRLLFRICSPIFSSLSQRISVSQVTRSPSVKPVGQSLQNDADIGIDGGTPRKKQAILRLSNWTRLVHHNSESQLSVLSKSASSFMMTVTIIIAAVSGCLLIFVQAHVLAITQTDLRAIDLRNTDNCGDERHCISSAGRIMTSFEMFKPATVVHKDRHPTAVSCVSFE